MGLEPMTSPLPRECSTTELQEQTPKNLNSRLLHAQKTSPKPFPLEKLEREKGLEPSTLGLESRCSSQLSYSRTISKVLSFQLVMPLF